MRVTHTGLKVTHSRTIICTQLPKSLCGLESLIANLVQLVDIVRVSSISVLELIASLLLAIVVHRLHRSATQGSATYGLSVTDGLKSLLHIPLIGGGLLELGLSEAVLSHLCGLIRSSGAILNKGLVIRRVLIVHTLNRILSILDPILLFVTSRYRSLPTNQRIEWTPSCRANTTNNITHFSPRTHIHACRVPFRL